MAFEFARIQNTPVLAKGGTYNSVVADALAAPSATWDGTRFVMTASIWNIANSKWYSIFLTSPDLITWTYVANSLRSPAGSDYILGNGSILWWGSKYYFAYSHYVLSGSFTVTLDYSTDLLSWTNVADPLYSGVTDPGLNLGPTGNIELWSGGGGGTDTHFADSPDGTNWTDHGIYHSAPAWSTGGYGEAHAFCVTGARWLVSDVAAELGRLRALYKSTGFNTVWTNQGTCLGASSVNAWEGAQVFDGAIVGAFDLGNGLGTKLWLLYAGGDNRSLADNTNSSVGLAYLDVPAVPSSFAPSLFRAANLTFGAGGRSFVNPLL